VRPDRGMFLISQGFSFDSGAPASLKWSIAERGWPPIL
jgi:hypothetical protein